MKNIHGSHPLRNHGSHRLPTVMYGGEGGDSLCLRNLCEDLILCEHADLRGNLPSCMGVRVRCIMYVCTLLSYARKKTNKFLSGRRESFT